MIKRQYTDTFSILNYLQNHCLWRKKTVKTWSYIIWKIPNYLENHRLWRKKPVKIGTILFRKSSKDPSWLAMCNIYVRNKLPSGCQCVLMPFNIRVTSCRYELAVIFTCRLCIDIAMSNRHVSFGEYSDNR